MFKRLIRKLFFKCCKNEIVESMETLAKTNNISVREMLQNAEVTSQNQKNWAKTSRNVGNGKKRAADQAYRKALRLAEEDKKQGYDEAIIHFNEAHEHERKAKLIDDAIKYFK